jgi:hypothetical protein
MLSRQKKSGKNSLGRRKRRTLRELCAEYFFCRYSTYWFAFRSDCLLCQRVRLSLTSIFSPWMLMTNKWMLTQRITINCPCVENSSNCLAVERGRALYRFMLFPLARSHFLRVKHHLLFLPVGEKAFVQKYFRCRYSLERISCKKKQWEVTMKNRRNTISGPRSFCFRVDIFLLVLLPP